MPLLLRADELWAAARRDSGRDRRALDRRGDTSGRRTAGPSPAACAAPGSGACRTSCSTRREIRRRFPTLTPADDEVALYEQRAGFVSPEETVAAHLALAARAGAELHHEETGPRLAAPTARGRGPHRGGPLHRGPAGRLPGRRGRRSCWPTWASRSASSGRCSTGSPGRRARNRSGPNGTRSTSGRPPTGSSSTASRRSTTRRRPGRGQGRRSPTRSPCSAAGTTRETIDRTVHPDEVGGHARTS